MVLGLMCRHSSSAIKVNEYETMGLEPEYFVDDVGNLALCLDFGSTFCNQRCDLAFESGLDNLEMHCSFLEQAGMSIAENVKAEDNYFSHVLKEQQQCTNTVFDSESTDVNWCCYLDADQQSYNADLVAGQPKHDSDQLAFKNVTLPVIALTSRLNKNARSGDNSSSLGGNQDPVKSEVSEQQAPSQCLSSSPQYQEHRASAPRAKRPRDSYAPDAAAVAVAPKRGKGNRGAHVRHRPDMQQVARDGAAHWQQRLRQVRAEWTAAAGHSPDGFRSRYQPQLDAAAGHVKAKLECLLRTLQLAAHGGAILPAQPPAGTAAPSPVDGFFGWTGFVVAAGREREWRGAVEGLFPAGFKEETVRETFRRAGLVPAGWRWREGWSGQVPFVPVVRDATPPAK